MAERIREWISLLALPLLLPQYKPLASLTWTIETASLPLLPQLKSILSTVSCPYAHAIGILREQKPDLSHRTTPQLSLWLQRLWLSPLLLPFSYTGLLVVLECLSDLISGPLYWLFELPGIFCTLTHAFSPPDCTALVSCSMYVTNLCIMGMSLHHSAWLPWNFLWNHRKWQSLSSGATWSHREVNVPMASVTNGIWWINAQPHLSVGILLGSSESPWRIEPRCEQQ